MFAEWSKIEWHDGAGSKAVIIIHNSVAFWFPVNKKGKTYFQKATMIVFKPKLLYMLVVIVHAKIISWKYEV